MVSSGERIFRWPLDQKVQGDPSVPSGFSCPWQRPPLDERGLGSFRAGIREGMSHLAEKVRGPGRSGTEPQLLDLFSALGIIADPMGS